MTDTWFRFKSLYRRRPANGSAGWAAFAIACMLLAGSAWSQQAMYKNGMVLIPARDASFVIGSVVWFGDESPLHTVTLGHNFYMDTTEVTQQTYRQVMSSVYQNYAEPTWGVTYGAGDLYPAYSLEWGDAALFCNGRSKLEGLDTVYQYTAISGHPGNGCSLQEVTTRWAANGYRLPTEAEWEFACRAGSSTDFYWGKEFLDYPLTAADTLEVNSYAVWAGNAWNFHAEHPDFGTHRVASKKPNAFGLYDMSGNVFEWINDWYAEYGSEPVKDPIGSATESYHFVRGGSWGNGVEYLRSANRTFASPDYYIYFCGFRTVLPLNTTSVGTRSWDNSNTVQDFHLDQNYPNPFNPSTTIRFQVPSTSVVTLAVYNSKGDEVSLLLDHQTLAAGRHTIDYEPSHLSAGVYFYRLITGERVLVKKMVLLQ